MQLKELRTKKGFTQSELAEKLNIAQTTISGWESGRNNIPYEMIEKIAHVLNVTVSEIDLPANTAQTPRLSDKEAQLLKAIRQFDSNIQLNLLSVLSLYFENISIYSRKDNPFIIKDFIAIISCMNDMLVKSIDMGDEFSYSYMAFKKYAELLKDLADSYALELE